MGDRPGRVPHNNRGRDGRAIRRQGNNNNNDRNDLLNQIADVNARLAQAERRVQEVNQEHEREVREKKNLLENYRLDYELGEAELRLPGPEAIGRDADREFSFEWSEDRLVLTLPVFALALLPISGLLYALHNRLAEAVAYVGSLLLVFWFFFKRRWVKVVHRFRVEAPDPLLADGDWDVCVRPDAAALAPVKRRAAMAWVNYENVVEGFLASIFTIKLRDKERYLISRTALRHLSSALNDQLTVDFATLEGRNTRKLNTLAINVPADQIELGQPVYANVLRTKMNWLKAKAQATSAPFPRSARECPMISEE